MRSLGKFITEWFREWWGLMGCAAFTFLGIYIAAANKSNAWVVSSSAILGGVLFFVASYRAWKRQHDARYALEKKKKKIVGEFSGFQMFMSDSRVSTCAFKVYLCVEGARVSVRSIRVKATDVCGNEATFDGTTFHSSDHYAPLILEPGIGVTYDASVVLGKDAPFVEKMSISAVDAFNVEHLLKPVGPQTFPFWGEQSSYGKADS